MSELREEQPRVSPVIATIASVLFPGLGYVLLREKKRALVAGGGVVLLFALGFLIAGSRVISVPGYEEDGYLKYAEMAQNGRVSFTTTPAIEVTDRVVRLQHDGTTRIEELGPEAPRGPSVLWLRANPMGVIGDNLSFLGQVFNGPLCAVGGYVSIMAARSSDPPIARSYSRLADIGALYTAVSGMLNLMIIVDTYARAARRQREAEALR